MKRHPTRLLPSIEKLTKGEKEKAKENAPLVPNKTSGRMNTGSAWVCLYVNS